MIWAETSTDFFQPRQKLTWSAIVAAALLLLSFPWGASAGEITTKQVIEALQGAASGAPPDFAGADLKFLDLSDLDFSHANFSKADLRSADLTGANFADADLSGANLTRATIIRADFTGADLSNANIYRPVTFSSVDAAPSEAPVFRRTKFSGARIVIDLIHADLSGADFSNARMELRREDLFMTTRIWWSNLADANFANANLSGVVFATSDLSRANFSGANLDQTTLFRCDLTDADVTGIDLNGAIVTDVKGLPPLP